MVIGERPDGSLTISDGSRDYELTPGETADGKPQSLRFFDVDYRRIKSD